jgi:hypothetical protein
MSRWIKKLFTRQSGPLLADVENGDANAKPKRSDLQVFKQLFVSYVWQGTKPNFHVLSVVSLQNHTTKESYALGQYFLSSPL